MPFKIGTAFRILPLLALLCSAIGASAQAGAAGTLRGTITDPSGAVVPGATVHLTNSVSGFDHTTTTDRSASSASPTYPSIPIASVSLRLGFLR